MAKPLANPTEPGLEDANEYPCLRLHAKKSPLMEEEVSDGESDTSGMKKVLLGESEVLTSDIVIIPFIFVQSMYWN